MRIQIVSDLHTEQDNPPPPLAPGADMITVAGDLGPVKHPSHLAEVVDEWNVAKHILYVPGNHEFFGSDANEAREILAGQCRIHAVTLLYRAAVTIEGVRFIGATLWTDFRLDGAHAEAAAHEAARGLSDFDGYIRQRAGTGRFTTLEAARRNSQGRAFIKHELAAARESGTTAVVITHHAPTPRSIAPRFEGNPHRNRLTAFV